MRQEYFDQTMEGMNNEPTPESTPVVVSQAKENIPVGPTDFLYRFLGKSTFGSMVGDKSICVLAFIVLLILLIIYLKK